MQRQKMVKLTLTIEEAALLASVADNGWDGGSFADWLKDAHEDEGQSAEVCTRAMQKLHEARMKAEG